MSSAAGSAAPKNRARGRSGGSVGASGVTTIQISPRPASTTVPSVTTSPGLAGSGNGSTRQTWGSTPQGSAPKPARRRRARRSADAMAGAACSPALPGRKRTTALSLTRLASSSSAGRATGEGVGPGAAASTVAGSGGGGRVGRGSVVVGSGAATWRPFSSISTAPIVTTWPGCTVVVSDMRRPSTLVPLVLLRSLTARPSPTGASRTCRRDTPASDTSTPSHSRPTSTGLSISISLVGRPGSLSSTT